MSILPSAGFCVSEQAYEGTQPVTAGPRGLSPCPPSPSKSSRSEASPRPACCTWRPVCLPGLAGPPALGGGGPGTASGCFRPRRQLGLRTRGGRWKEPGGTGPQSCIQALAALAAALGCADSCPFRGCRCPCSRQPALLSWARGQDPSSWQAYSASTLCPRCLGPPDSYVRRLRKLGAKSQGLCA